MTDSFYYLSYLSYSSLYLNFNVQSKSENGGTKLNMVRQTVQPYFDCNFKLCTEFQNLGGGGGGGGGGI